MAKLTDKQRDAIERAARIIETLGYDRFIAWMAANKVVHEAKLKGKI